MPRLWNTQTNQYEDVPEEHVRGALEGGQYGVATGKINVVDQAGKPYEIESTDLLDAVRKGWKIESGEQHRQRVLQETYGDVGGQVKAGLAGVARGLTFHLSDLAMAKLGFVPPEDLAGYKEANPIASTVGEGVGVIGSAALPGGAIAGLGKAGKAVGAATSAVRGVSRLGSVVTRGVESLAVRQGAGLAERAAVKALSVGAGSAVEGAFYGAGQVIGEEALAGDDGIPLTAERVLAGIGSGALLGAAGGALVGGGGAVIGAGARKVADVTSRALKKETIREAAESLAAESAVKATGARGTDVRSLRTDEKIKQVGTDLLEHKMDDGTDLLRAGDRAEDLKPRLEQARDQAVKKLEDFRAEVASAARADPELAPNVEELMERLDAGVLRELKEHPVPEIAKRARRVEHIFDKLRYRQEAAKSAFEEAAWTSQKRVQETSGILKQIEREIKKTQNDIAKFAKPELRVAQAADKVANVQTQIDDVAAQVAQSTSKSEISALNRTLRSLRARRTKLAKKAEELLEPGTMRNMTKEREILEGRLKELSQQQIQQQQAVADALQQQADLRLDPTHTTLEELTQIRKGLDRIIYPKKTTGGIAVAPASAEQLQAARGVLEDYINTKTEAIVAKRFPGLEGAYATMRRKAESFLKASELVNKATKQNLGNRWTSPSDIAMGLSTMVMTGNLSGLLLGGAASVAHKFVREKARSAVARAAYKVANMSALERATVQADRRMAAGIGRILSPQKALTKVTAYSARGDWSGGGRVRTAGLAAQRSLYGWAQRDKNESRSDAHKRRLEHLSTIAVDPVSAIERMGGAAEGLSDAAPNITQAMLDNAARAAAHLYEVAPKPTEMQDDLQPGLDEDWQISDYELDAFEQRLEVANDPLSVLDHAANGTLTSEGLDTFRTLYPGLHQQITRRVLRAASESKDRLPYKTRLRLGALLGVPTDLTLRPDFVAAMQAGFVPQEEPQQSDGGMRAGGLGGGGMAERAMGTTEKLSTM